jgi:F-type H+-transporting ATPase subunit gamma
MPLQTIDTTDQEANSDEFLELEPDDTILWEQPQEEVLDFLAIRYLRSTIIQHIFQALRAEHAARFMAMENSTNNAEKYLDRLTLQFNKLRQSLITKEVSELSSSLPQR